MTDNTRNLRLDRRLLRRRGWLPPEELESELNALPDVSDKILPPEEAEETGSPAGAASPGGPADPGDGA